jgi:hypothetical protein
LYPGDARLVVLVSLFPDYDDFEDDDSTDDGPPEGTPIIDPGEPPVDIAGDILKPLRDAPRFYRHAVLDIETRNTATSEPIPYALGYSEDGVRVKVYEGKDLFDRFLRDYLVKPNIGVRCYAHNGGRFDFLPLLERFFRGTEWNRKGFRVRVCAINSCLYKLIVTKVGVRGKWIFMDSLRLFGPGMSLDRVGKTFETGGLRKLSDIGERLGCTDNSTRPCRLCGRAAGDEHDRGFVYNVLALPKNRAVMLEYLHNDCKVLHRGIADFQTIMHRLGGEMKGTASACAMDLYRRAFLPRLAYNVHRNRHFSSCPDQGKLVPKCKRGGCGHSYIRGATAGGRTEIFTSEGKDLLYFDFTSMYPAVMMEPFRWASPPR